MNVIRLFITLCLGLMLFVSLVTHKTQASVTLETGTESCLDHDPTLLPEFFLNLVHGLVQPEPTEHSAQVIHHYHSPDIKLAKETHRLLQSNLPPPAL